MKTNALTILAVILSSCATPYQSKGLLGGFTETQISADTYRVGFGANAYTGEDVSYDYALLRCAEIGQKNGFSYFVLKDSDSIMRTTGASHTGNLWGSSTHIQNKPRVFLTAQFFRSRPSTSETIYDCALIIRSVKQKHSLE